MMSMVQKIFRPKTAATALLAGLLLAGGCRKEDMSAQPKALPFEASVFFANGTSARPLIVGTVARGHLQTDDELYTGMVFVDGKRVPIDHFPSHYPTESDGPFPTHGQPLRDVLARGKQQFTIFCSMCHGDAGDGQGIIVQRGFVPPPSYHIDRLRTAPVGHFFDVINNGYQAMYSYGDRVSPADRWAIVAYIRTLQMSQGTVASELSPADQEKLNEAKQVKAQ